MATRSGAPRFWLFGLLVSCTACTAEEGLDLSGREFVSESLVGRELLPGTQVGLRFESSELSAGAGCNGMFGNYSFDGSVLVVSSMASTEIGCDAARHDQDEWLAGFLTARPTAELTEPRLTLSSATETLTLLDREVASPDRPLVDTPWIGNGVGDGEGVTFGPKWTLATITFGSDGRVEVFSGCQHGSGDFAADETTIAFTDLTYDGLPCDDPSLQTLSDTVLLVLDGSQVAFGIEERELKIDRAGYSLYFLAND